MKTKHLWEYFIVFIGGCLISISILSLKLEKENKTLTSTIDSLNKEVIQHHEFLNKQENEIKRLEKENLYLIRELRKTKQENEVIKIY